MSSLSGGTVTLRENKIRVALGDPDTPGLVLYTIALYKFGNRVMGDAEAGEEAMDPAEMWADLHEYYGTWVPDEGENKLNAIIAGLEQGAFWRDFDTFQAVATALLDGDLGDLIDVGFEELSATEIMWAILEMELAWDSDDTPEFSREIKSYVDKMLRMEQDDQDENAREVEKNYVLMLDQLHDLGVPLSVLRTLDEDYAEVTERVLSVQ